MRLLEVTARSGMSADKVSAYTCLVEDNPIANLRAFDSLLSMVTSKEGKCYAFTSFEALKELFLLSYEVKLSLARIKVVGQTLAFKEHHPHAPHVEEPKDEESVVQSIAKPTGAPMSPLLEIPPAPTAPPELDDILVFGKRCTKNFSRQTSASTRS
ncbi:hypothetical protein ZIOFF_052374 [Zingiber officinale]|uniref:Uncharacterized protein n=1 Tax=Zingiber officinale TaxID=94328 RepID=A0A8J5KU04_ZINOF|nr:hypothetical protein ZIOFF_052374 [Zingiber officinale]